MTTGTRRRPTSRLCRLYALELRGRTARLPPTRDEVRIPPLVHARPKRSARPPEGTARSPLPHQYAGLRDTMVYACMNVTSNGASAALAGDRIAPPSAT